jgi:hypothetical protein
MQTHVELGVRVATAEEIAAFVRGGAEAKPTGDETVIIYLVSWMGFPRAGRPLLPLYMGCRFIAPIAVSLLTILSGRR